MKKLFKSKFVKGLISEIPFVGAALANIESKDSGEGKTDKQRLAGQITALIVAVLTLLETFGVIDAF